MATVLGDLTSLRDLPKEVGEWNVNWIPYLLAVRFDGQLVRFETDLLFQHINDLEQRVWDLENPSEPEE